MRLPRTIRRLHVVIGKRIAQFPLHLLDSVRSERHADQRLHLGAQLRWHLGLGNPSDVYVLDQIARVDVGLPVLVADVRDDEHDAHGVGIRNRKDANRGDEPGLLGLDPRCQFVEPLATERTTGESRDLLLESGTESAQVEPGHLRRADRRAFRRIDLLRVCRQRQREKCEQQSKCCHARGQSKPGAIA